VSARASWYVGGIEAGEPVGADCCEDAGSEPDGVGVRRAQGECDPVLGPAERKGSGSGVSERELLGVRLSAGVGELRATRVGDSGGEKSQLAGVGPTGRVGLREGSGMFGAGELLARGGMHRRSGADLAEALGTWPLQASGVPKTEGGCTGRSRGRGVEIVIRTKDYSTGLGRIYRETESGKLEEKPRGER
jgi:hypothetical protein